MKRTGLSVLTLLGMLLVSACGAQTSAIDEQPVITTEAETVDSKEGLSDDLKESVSNEVPYSDILASHPHYDAIASAKDKGLLEGFTADDNFRPDDNLDNANMALLFYNMAGRPELTEEAKALQIANLEEVGEEQAIAIRWYSQAFAGYGFTTEDDEINFLPPDSFARNVDFSNTVFLATEQFEGDSPLADEYAEYRGPEEEEVTEITRAEAVEVLNRLTDTFPVGTEFAQELSEEVLAQINPPAEQPVEVAVTPTPAPTSTPAPQQQEATQQQEAQQQAPAPAPAPTPEPAPTPTPAPGPQPEVAPATPAGDMNNIQWVRDQIAGHAEACGFYCSQPAGSQISLSVYDIDNRKWQILDFACKGDGTWGLLAWTDFYGDSDLIYVSSIEEIKAFISNHAH